MSGISSRKGTIAFAVQTAKGTPATVPAVKVKLSGSPSLMPSKTRARYAMTDSSQDQGPAYTSSMGIAGDVPVYAHPDFMAFVFACVLGQSVDSGVNPNYIHTITPADDMLWVTIWREVGGVITEKFTDCKIHAVKVAGQAGQPVTMTLSIMGLNGFPLQAGAELTALQGLAPLSSLGYLYPEAHGLIKLNGVVSKIHQINFGIDRGASPYQADDYVATDIDPGARTFTLDFATRFQSGAIGVSDYNTFFYGGNAGAALSPVVGQQPFEVMFQRNANLSVDILLPTVSYAGMPINPDPNGNPIEVQVATEVETPAVGTQICTIVSKDQTLKGTIL